VRITRRLERDVDRPFPSTKPMTIGLYVCSGGIVDLTGCRKRTSTALRRSAALRRTDHGRLHPPAVGTRRITSRLVSGPF